MLWDSFISNMEWDGHGGKPGRAATAVCYCGHRPNIIFEALQQVKRATTTLTVGALGQIRALILGT